MNESEMKTDVIQIGQKQAGEGQPCFIICEIAQAHDGSLGFAHAYIDAIADAGADAIKFQTHIAQAESSVYEPFRVRFSQQDQTRFDYWKRMEFPEEHWHGLAEHAVERGLVFLSSPFSEEAVDLLQRVGMPAWKVASGEVNNPIMLEKMVQAAKETHAPVLISSGMSTITELDKAVQLVQDADLQAGIFQCTSKYPLQPEELGLEYLAFFEKRFNIPVGLSDHSGTMYAGLAAATLGANMLEVHVTMSREMFGPDVPASVTTAELQNMINGIRYIEKALGSKVNKDEDALQFETMRNTFGKALVLNTNLKKGEKIERHHLTDRKPASQGISVTKLYDVVGKTLVADVEEGEFLQYSQMKGMSDGK